MLNRGSSKSQRPRLIFLSGSEKINYTCKHCQFFVTLGFALESFLLVLLRGNAKIVSKDLVCPAVYKVLRAFMSRRYVTGIPSIFTVSKLSYLGEHSEVSQARLLHAC